MSSSGNEKHVSFYRDYHDKTALEAWNERVRALQDDLVTPSPPRSAPRSAASTDAIPPEQLAEIQRASAERLVLVFRNQRLSVDDQKRFARHFGRLHQHALAASSLIAGASQDPAVLAWKTNRESAMRQATPGITT